MGTPNVEGQQWEEYHKSGYFNTSYPFEDILRFVFRYSRKMGGDNLKVLDLGCGSGNNLGFVAENQMRAFGIDISETAIANAQKKYADLEIDFRVGSFDDLPYEDTFFDLIFDRKSITCTSKKFAKESIKEAYRVLKPGGFFLFTPLSDADSRFMSGPAKEGFVEKTEDERIQQTVPFRGYSFFSLHELRDLFSEAWKIEELRLIQQTEMHRPDRLNLASWELVAQKL